MTDDPKDKDVPPGWRKVGNQTIGPILLTIGDESFTFDAPTRPSWWKRLLAWMWRQFCRPWLWIRDRFDDRPAKRLEQLQRQYVEQYLVKIPPTSIGEIGTVLGLIGETHRVHLQRKYPQRIFNLMMAWLVVVFAVLWLKAFRTPEQFRLSDEIVITILASTTATMVGLFVIVLKFLFPSNASPGDTQDGGGQEDAGGGGDDSQVAEPATP